MTIAQEPPPLYIYCETLSVLLTDIGFTTTSEPVFGLYKLQGVLMNMSFVSKVFVMVPVMQMEFLLQTHWRSLALIVL